MRFSHLSRRAYLLGGTSYILDVFHFMAHLYKKDRNISSYEKLVQTLLNTNYVFSYGSGRMGLYEILKALDIGLGDEVILPGYTCIAVPMAIIRTGAKPVYADIDIKTLNLDINSVTNAITHRTRLIIAQHTFGIPCNLRALQAIACRHSLHLVEDCAHALGAKYQNVYCGNFGVAAFFSTEKTKMISTERGGLVTTNQSSLAEKLMTSYERLPFERKRRTLYSVARWSLHSMEYHPRIGDLIRGSERKVLRKLRAVGRTLEKIEYYDRELYDRHLNGQLEDPFPTKLSPELALLGRLQLSRLESDVIRRNKLARRLIESADRFGWQVPEVNWDEARPSFVRFPFMVDARDEWIKLLAESGIQAGTWFNHPIHPEGSNYTVCQYRLGTCPVAEKVSKRIINIPMNSRIGDWMIDAIEKKFFGRQGNVSEVQYAT